MAEGQASGDRLDKNPASGTRGRVLMIGLDAYSLEFAGRHLDHLPVMREFLQSPGAHPLTGPADCVSAGVWATFACGSPLGSHGHFYPYQWRAGEMRFRRTSTVPIPDSDAIEPFWRPLARAGLRVIALDIGAPIDPAGAPCLEIVNWSNQSNGAALASEPAVLSDLRRRFGKRPIGKEVPVPKKLSRSRRMRDDMIRSVNAKTDAVLHLAERRAWDLFLVGFYEVHRAGHNLLRVENDFGSAVDREALLDVYKAQDAALGRLVAALGAGDVTVVLFALHSIEPNRAQDHFVREVIGRLNAKWREEQGAPPEPPKGPNLMARLRAVVPPDLQYTLAHLLGEHIQDYVVGRSYVGGLDWSKTWAFALPSGGEWYIRYNLKGRERDGALDLSTAEGRRFAAWLKERLFELKVADTNAPFVSEIVELQQRFQGPRSDVLPDLLVKCAPDEPVTAIASPAVGRLESRLSTGRGGNHHEGKAFFIARGPGAFDERVRIVSDIADLGAFAQSLLGMDARVCARA